VSNVNPKPEIENNNRLFKEQQRNNFEIQIFIVCEKYFQIKITIKMNHPNGLKLYAVVKDKAIEWICYKLNKAFGFKKTKGLL
jgi:hypothetical protein